MANPVIGIQNLNAELSSVNAKFDLLSVVNAGQTALGQYASAVETKLGTQIGQSVSGFQSLTQELDDVAPIVNGSVATSSTLSQLAQSTTGIGSSILPSETISGGLAGFGGAASQLNTGLENAAGVSNRGVALLAENPPGLEIQKQASGSNSDLESLTEDTMGGGFLQFAVTAATPEALANTLSKITGEPVNKITSALQDVAPGIVGSPELLQSTIGNVLQGKSIVEGFTSALSGFAAAALGSLTQGLTGVINNAIEVSAGPYRTALSGITKGLPIPDLVSLEVKTSIESGLVSKAAELLLPYSQLSVGEIEAQLLTIPTTLSEMVSNDNMKSSISTPVNTIGKR